MVRRNRIPYRFNRRNVLAAMTMAGVGGLAGCLGDDDDDPGDDGELGEVDDRDLPTDDDDDTADDDTADDIDDDVELERRVDQIGAQISEPLELEEYNQWANPTDPPLRFWLSTPGFATWDPEVQKLLDGHTWEVNGQEIEAVMMTRSVEHPDNTTTEITIRDDITDWEGNQVTVHDFFKVDQIWHLEVQFESDDWEPWEDDDGLIIEDDYSYTSNHDPTPMPELEWTSGFWTKWDSHMYWPDGSWIDAYVERLEDAATQDEVDEIMSDIQGVNIDGWDVLENQYGYGPYQFVPENATDTEVVGTLRDDHPAAEYIDIPELVLHIAEGGSEREELLARDGAFDIQSGVHTQPDLVTMREEAPEHFEQMSVYQGFGSTQVLFNWDHKDLGNRWVRRAIVEASDWPNMLANADNVVEAANARNNKYWAYNSQPLLEAWIDQDVLDQFYGYTPESNFDQAAEFMERGGYTQEDGVWVDENGDSVQLEYLAGAWDDLVIYMETMRSNLEEFGFEGELVTVDDWPMYQRVDENQYDIVPMWIGGGGQPYPWLYYRTSPGWQETNFVRRVEGLTDWVWEWEVPEEDRPETDVQGRSLFPTIPEEPGALEVEGDGIELDIVQMTQDLMHGDTSTSRRREIVELFARWANFNQPDVWMTEGQLRGYAANTRDYHFPEGGGREMTDEFIDYDIYYIKTGMVQPVYDEVE